MDDRRKLLDQQKGAVQCTPARDGLAVEVTGCPLMPPFWGVVAELCVALFNNMNAYQL